MYKFIHLYTQELRTRYGHSGLSVVSGNNQCVCLRGKNGIVTKMFAVSQSGDDPWGQGAEGEDADI